VDGEAFVVQRTADVIVVAQTGMPSRAIAWRKASADA